MKPPAGYFFIKGDCREKKGEGGDSDGPSVMALRPRCAVRLRAARRGPSDASPRPTAAAAEFSLERRRGGDGGARRERGRQAKVDVPRSPSIQRPGVPRNRWPSGRSTESRPRTNTRLGDNSRANSSKSRRGDSTSYSASRAPTSSFTHYDKAAGESSRPPDEETRARARARAGEASARSRALKKEWITRQG